MNTSALAAPGQRAKPYPTSSPEARALNAVGAKWTLLVVKALLEKPMRFVTLQREGCPGISTEQLRTCVRLMEGDGLLTRTRHREVPPRVMYELTEKGRALEGVLRELGRWGSAHNEKTGVAA